MLEITGETSPCNRMDQEYLGLKNALATGWRGGVLCRVIKGGKVKIGSEVNISKDPFQFN